MADARPLWRWVSSVCNGASEPVLVERALSGDTVLAAASLHTRALSTWHAWRQLGVRPRDLIEDPLPRGIEAVVRLLACLSGGLVWRPLPEGATPVSASERSTWRLNPNGSLTRVEPVSTAAPLPIPDGACVLLQTSGSEGTPKQVALTQAAICWQLERHREVLSIESGSVRVMTLPWTHAFGLVLDLLLGLVSRQTLEVAPMTAGWSPKQLAERLALAEADWWCTVPRVLELVMNAAPPSRRGPRNVLVGGALISPRLQAEASAWLDPKGALHVGYGLTEAGPGVAMNGRLLPGIEARIDAGTLVIRSPSWCGPGDASQWHHTNDLATLDACGHLEVVGRASRVVKGPDGLWTSLDAFEVELARRLGGRAVCVARRGLGFTVIALVDGAPIVDAALPRFIERRLGGPVDLHLESVTETVWRALAATPSKSLSGALDRMAAAA
jgi:acyl-coenzyme A synthetase/AMP-(fatty) acid ligase